MFYVKEPTGVIVMIDGEVTHRYKNVREFVEAHIKGAKALEREMEEVLEKHYKPD